ncbi:Hypothetical predicted protein [Cloeon dipterum]|uniref:DH domain-containing protein n=1 Tax=Cloeon dipterum TaxID=197152 RepID=A0A8S1DZ30_9INSE|nr:Hypothetical predicted protein [Cloeon dipterum]
MARARAISESEDDEELVEQFFKKQKQKKNEEMTPRKDPEEYEIGDDSFIVEDDVIYVDSDVSDDEVEQQKNFSPSFYLRVLNDQRKANASSDVTIKEANWSEARKLFTQVKTPKGKNKNDMKTPKRYNDGFHRPTLGFLASLSTEEPSVLCHPDAVPFLKNFKSRKDDLVEKLFALFNRTVFDDKLDPEMSITWNNRLRSTAGFCYNQRKRVEGGDTIRFSRIELSGKILQNAGQLRDTLIHEMCHAATWVIDEMLGGHGPVWKKWTRKANRIHPELPEIKRCHSYQIETAYTYRCTKCQYSFGRSSKSLDTERKVCGYCKGKFELIVNNKKGTPREPKGFALFVKENYKIVKQKDMKHKDVMQLLTKCKPLFRDESGSRSYLLNERPTPTECRRLAPTAAAVRRRVRHRANRRASECGAAPRVDVAVAPLRGLSTDEPRVAVVRSAAASTRTGSTAKRRPPVAAAAVPLVDELRVCHGAVSHTIKIFEKIENNKVNVMVPKESANGHWSASPKPKVMLKPSASFISRKASELRAVTSRRSNQVRPTVDEPASEVENVPTKNKEEKSDEPPLPPPNKTPKQVPNSTFRSYLHSISKENLNGLPLEKATLPRIEETSSAVDCDFNESDIVRKSEDTSLVEEVLKELESNKLIAECKVRLDQLTVARAQPNVSFLFSNSAAQQTTQILEGATESWSSEDYDDVYSFQPMGQDNKAELDEEYDYPLPQGDQDYDDCGPVGEGIYEDTATVYESIGSCAPSYFEKNSFHSIGSRAETISCNDGRSDIEVGSETSSSDVWVDLDISEPEEKPARLIEMTPVYREKAKNRRSPSWSLKVRRQWTHSAKKRFINYKCVFDGRPNVAPPRPAGPDRRPSIDESSPMRHISVNGVSSSASFGTATAPRRPRPTVVDKVFVDTRHSVVCFVLPEEQAEARPRRPARRRPPVVTLRLLGEHRETQEICVFFKEGPSNSASDDNLYEPLYEMLPPRQGAAKEVPTVAPPPPPLLDENYDSDITDSSFDSDSDVKFENVTLRRDEVHLPELPPPPTGQTGGITKIAEAASKKMKDIKRTWKRGISDKLRRLSTPNPAAIYEAQQKTLQEISVAETSPPTKEPTKNKYWTFRKNSKSGQSPRLSTQKSTDSSSSIFYVSQEIEPVDRLAELINSCNRHSSGPSSSSASLESDVGPKRHSSSIIRPKTPPPPPPTESNYKRLSESRPKEMYAEIEFSSLEQHNSFSENDSQSQKTESSEEIAGNGKGTSACFEDEPLYQFYAESVLQEAQRQLNEESDSDGYEEIGEKMMMLSSRPSAMELIKPHAHTGQRSLWCEVPDVINSGVLDRLSQQQRKLQEAKFEIITSEASYIKSLNVLIMHFVLCPELQDDLVLSKTDRDILFSGIRPVKSCSEHFLSDLEKCWQESILLTNISSIMEKHAAKNMNVYIKYCSQQIYLDRTLKHLRETNASFASVLSKLEGHPECQSLSLHSFLMLPMQRVTRLPLLFDAVLRRLSANSDEYTSCKNALMMVNKLVQDCNEEARKMERMKEMIELSRQLEFRSEMRAVPLISSSRWLVRSGEMTQLLTRDEAKLTFGRRIAKQVVNVFLFTDLLVVAKKKGDEGYHVIDYCARNMIDVVNPEEYAEGTINLPWKIHDISSKNMLILTLLQNHEKKTNEMVLSCSLESDKQRWLAAITTPQINQNNSEERVYESWDCPQVQAIHAYVAQQPDELSLEVADVVNVLRKLPDGWYQGERIRDGECGWFPENYCKEILSSHVRARNLRQRYRLLALTSEYIDVQRKAARVGGANSSKIKLTSSEKLEVH